MKIQIRSIVPLLLLIALNMVGMNIIMRISESSSELMILCIGMCVLSVAVYVLINVFALGDNYLYIIVALLASIGIIMLSRIDLYGNTSFGIANMEMFLFGVVMFFMTILAYRIFYKKLKNWFIIYFGISIVLYIGTALFGTEINGAKNWISLGGFTLQPSEFIKILLILTIAAILTYSKKEDTGKKRYSSTMGVSLAKKTLVTRRIMAITALTYIHALFLFVQGEWGTAVLSFAVYLAFLFVYDKNRLFFFLNTALIIVVVIFGMKYVGHISERVVAWLNPFSDPGDKGYHTIHAMLAIKDGGFSGMGIGNGISEQLPMLESDSIFAVICEEMGVFGGVGVLMLYFVLVYRGFKIALTTVNPFNKAVAFGISVMLGVQTFIIVGGITKLIPFTGITLPFISHGGSSMISTFIAVGILQAISSVKGDNTDELE